MRPMILPLDPTRRFFTPAHRRPYPYGIGRRLQYRHVLLATDFAATTDIYHRHLHCLARAIGGRTSLLHLPADTQADDPCASILLDGLVARLGLTPRAAWIARAGELRSTLEEAAIGHGVDLVIAGAWSAAIECGPCREVARIAPMLGCDVMTLDDGPEWL